jgi:transcriptional regulator with XRE-family HTH domain
MNDPPESDPAHTAPPSNALEAAIGKQARAHRRELGLTAAEVARRAGLSVGMLSKIENGNTSPSLNTLKALSAALDVPVTSLFRQFQEEREVTHVRAGEGLKITRYGTRAGHQYELLGHNIGKPYSVEPYLITLTAQSDVFPIFQHAGNEFIYVLEGRVIYRHADQTYALNPGDSLYFDADAPHGPEHLVELPLRLLSVIVQSGETD